MLYSKSTSPLPPETGVSKTTLNKLNQGQIGIIRDVLGDDGIAIRLLEMGLTDGEPITLVGAAPLGDPLEFALRGYRLSLRISEAERVEIDLPS